MSVGTFAYPLCFTAMLFAIGLMVVPRTDEVANVAAHKARLERQRRNGIAAEILVRSDDFLRRYPESEQVEQIAMLAAVQCVELENWPEVARRYRELEARFSQSRIMDRFVFLQAVAFYKEARFDEAVVVFRRVLKAFPTRSVLDNASYYLAMAYFRNHQNEQALAASYDYLRSFPEGRYVEGLRQRLAAVGLKGEGNPLPERMLGRFSSFLAAHPDEPTNGAMFCLLADHFRAMTAATAAGRDANVARAIEAYTQALWTDTSEAVLQHALVAASDLLIARHDWRALRDLHTQFLCRHERGGLARNPTNEWARVREAEMCRKILAGLLKPDFANPDCAQVDDWIDDLARSYLPQRERMLFDWTYAETGLERILRQTMGDLNHPTAAARYDYAFARVAQAYHLSWRATPLIDGIATRYAKEPSALSPRLLEICGKVLLKRRDRNGAAAMFQRLHDHFPQYEQGGADAAAW